MSSETAQQIEGILQTWTRQLDNPPPNNPQMAKMAVNQLYLHAKKPEPFHIIWCESPFQFSVLPSVISNVINSSRWDLFQARLNNAGDPTSQKWKDLWNEYFPAIHDEIAAPLVHRITDYQFPGTSEQAVNRALQQLVVYLKTIAMSGRINRDNLHQRKLDRKKFTDKDRLFPSPFDADHWTIAVRLTASFEKRTRVTAGLTPAAISGWFSGVIDERIVTSRIPVVSEFVKVPPRLAHSQERVDRLRTKFTEYDRRANQRTAWLASVLMGRPRAVPTPDFAGGVNVRSVLENSYRILKDVTDEIASESRGNTSAIWGHQMSWLPFALACRLIEPELIEDLDEEIDSRALLHHAALGYMFGKNLAFVCAKPDNITLNDGGQPHNPAGPAATWSDGFACYSYRGTVVPSWFITAPERITMEAITAERNAEYRRVMISIFGEDRFIQESGAKLIHEDSSGQLFRQELVGDEALTMVRVKNSTAEPDGTYRYYFLRVPPDMVRARQAVAWTFGVDENDYRPSVQS